MEIFGKEFNIKLFFYVYVINGLIIADMFLITIALLFYIPDDIILDIELFDLFVCVILLIDWFVTLYKSSPRSTFLKQKDNIIDLIASIPFDIILMYINPTMVLLKYLRLLKLLRVMFLFKRLFDRIKMFLHKTNMGKILGGVFFTVLIFTLLLYLFGPSYGLFDDFYFVIVTLTTVGYGDVTPQNIQ